jgi:glyoxylase-like metal-dependent hydrolase (beta-lactamase superfamily II)
MLFRQLFDRESSTYTYLVADEGTREAVLIDPVSEQIDRDLQVVDQLGLTLRYVLDTHVHADHVTATGPIADRTGARIVTGRRAGACADVFVGRGDVIRVGGLRLDVLETPGHTDDSVSYALADRVFTGDALLIRGCGRTDFQNGDPAALYHSITGVLFDLPGETLVYPAHDYKGRTVTTIAEEKRFNERVTGRSRDEFVALMKGLGLPPPKLIDVAVPANRACGRGAPR